MAKRRAWRSTSQSDESLLSEVEKLERELRGVGASGDAMVLVGQSKNLLRRFVAGGGVPLDSLWRLGALVRRVARSESRLLPLTDNRRPEPVSVEALL